MYRISIFFTPLRTGTVQIYSERNHSCATYARVLGLLSPLSAYFSLINVTQMLCLPNENPVHLHDFLYMVQIWG